MSNENYTVSMARQLDALQAGQVDRAKKAQSAGYFFEVGPIKLSKTLLGMDFRSKADLDAQNAPKAMEHMMEELQRLIDKCEDTLDNISRPSTLTG